MKICLVLEKLASVRSEQPNNLTTAHQVLFPHFSRGSPAKDRKRGKERGSVYVCARRREKERDRQRDSRERNLRDKYKIFLYLHLQWSNLRRRNYARRERARAAAGSLWTNVFFLIVVFLSSGNLPRGWGNFNPLYPSFNGNSTFS